MQREFPSAPLAGVGAVVVHQGRVLLIRRGTEPALGQWSLPGGLVELGESLAEALRREVREETGLLVEPVELVELLDRIYREDRHEDGHEDGRVRYHYIIADYLCRVTGGELRAASDAAAVRWVERGEWNSQSGLASGLALDPITARVVEAGWRRARQIEAGGQF
jgi:8-oxo-dGTP diphosphatase